MKEETRGEVKIHHKVRSPPAGWPEFRYLSDAQLQADLDKCSSCADKPCRTACPVNCDPSEFILALKVNGGALPHDYELAAAHIMSMNAFGGSCGAVCPDKHCMKSCTRKDIDAPVNIPAVQATIIHRARTMGYTTKFTKPIEKRPQSVCVVGAGPSGLSAAAVLLRMGYHVTVLEKRSFLGGATNTIPTERLPRELLNGDLQFLSTLGDLTVKYNRSVDDAKTLLRSRGGSYDAVCVSAGLGKERRLSIPNEDLVLPALSYLWDVENHNMAGKRVAIIGGGPVGIDVATTALNQGADSVTMFYRRGVAEMPLSQKERATLLEYGINVIPRCLPTEIQVKEVNGEKTVCGLKTRRVSMPHRTTGKADTTFVEGSDACWPDIDVVVYSIGNFPALKTDQQQEGIFFSGDLANGSSTVVEASASGKNTAAAIHAYLNPSETRLTQLDANAFPMKSNVEIPGYDWLPTSLETDFYGVHKLTSPFLLSASPLTDGYEQVKKAYDAGWPGVIMKTAFQDTHIHIPNAYMAKFNDHTFGNSDNVSGHPLARVCAEIRRLTREYPDRLTCASTGGPVTGNDVIDKEGWQSNTLMCERAGAKAVEYSLSCPQGGDGSEGAIVSQSAAATARVVNFVMEVSDPNIPKIFKLTGAVTSVQVIVDAIRGVFAKYPHKKAGITLSNSFPGMRFSSSHAFEASKFGIGTSKPGAPQPANPDGKWEDGAVVGLAGEGITPISYLALANAAYAVEKGLEISGNGGPFDYLQAAHFIALGCRTVQFCTLPTKLGVGIISQLERATSHLLRARGIKSIEDLRCLAIPALAGFTDLTDKKQISTLDEEKCIHCGNCVRCPYCAITLDDRSKTPVIDPVKCISCGVCTLQCPAQALSLKDRTPAQAAVSEHECCNTEKNDWEAMVNDW